MKWTALLALAACLLVVAPATAATAAIRGTVVAEHIRSGSIVLAGPRGLGVTVRVSSRRVQLGDRVSIIGRRLPDGTIRASRLRVVSHVQRARIRGVVVKRLLGAFRIASGRSLLTIHRRGLASGDDTLRVGRIGEFELEIEDERLVAHGFKPVAEELEWKGTVVRSTSTHIAIDAGSATLTFAARPGVTLPVLAPGTVVEIRAASVNGVLTLERLHLEEDGGGSGGGGDDGGGHH